MVNLWEFFCFHKKFLVYTMVTRNLKIKYRRSVLGFLWTLLIPILQAGIYYLVFNRILKVQADNYVLFILTSLLLWGFFSNTLTEAQESLLMHSNLITKINIPLHAFPWIASITHAIILFLSLPVVVGISLLHGIRPTPSYFYLPVLILQLLLFAYSMGLVLSIIVIFFRDLRHLLAIGLQIWMYSTPVLYQAKMLPPEFSWVLWANPLGFIFSSAHRIVLEGSWPTLTQFTVPTLWAIGAAWVARAALNRARTMGVTEWL